jgi:hypothetical protein
MKDRIAVTVCCARSYGPHMTTRLAEHIPRPQRPEERCAWIIPERVDTRCAAPATCVHGDLVSGHE